MNLEQKSAIVQKILGSSVNVVNSQTLTGGMINSVEEWFLDSGQDSVVAKMSNDPGNEEVLQEYDSLSFYRKNTKFPVPQPYGFLSDTDLFSGSLVLMEKIEGQTLSSSWFAGSDREDIDRQMARHVAALHSVKRESYGHSVRGQKYEKFLDYYEPVIRYEYDFVKQYLSREECHIVEKLLDKLSDWLPERKEATLIHGDIWSTNVMIHSSQPKVEAFIDGAANFRDREQELAYLLIFNTASQTFFEEYKKYHSIEEGFDRRCRVFWLNTWLRHVRKFGTSYLEPSKRTIYELASMI